MNYLIGDIGNTNIKICKLNKRFKITKSFLFDTKDKKYYFGIGGGYDYTKKNSLCMKQIYMVYPSLI